MPILFKDTTFFKFIKEIVFRLIYITFSLAITFAISFYRYNEELTFFIIKPLLFENNNFLFWNFFFSKPFNFFLIQFKICFYISLLIIYPYILFQFFFFVIPAFKKHEIYKWIKYIITIIIFFIAYFCINFYIILPFFWIIFFKLQKKMIFIKLNYFPLLEPYFTLVFSIFYFTITFCFLPIFIIICVKKKWISFSFFFKKKKIIILIITIIGTILSGPELTQQIYSIFFIFFFFEQIIIILLYKYKNYTLNMIKIYKTFSLKKKSGRNNQGKITIRHRGGGHKQKIYYIDLYRHNFYKKFQVHSFLYNPIKNTNIALLQSFKKKIDYKLITHPNNTRLGQIFFDCIHMEQPFIEGYSFFIKDIPLGLNIYNIQTKPKIKATIAKAAGSKCEIIKKNKKFTTVKLPSGKEKKISNFCRAVIGIPNNSEIKFKKKTKAGENRWLGKRPSVRGLAINPVDHPHGGGEGKSRVTRTPVNPWGKIKKGKKK